MKKQIKISKESKKWLDLLRKHRRPSFLEQGPRSATTIELANLITWLNPAIILENNERFWLESLRTSLLRDVNDSFISDATLITHETKPQSWFAKMQFGLFTFAGTILAICQGFDAASPIFGLFVVAPAALVIILGLAFSTLSLAAFYGFDLVVISTNLGVKLHNSSKLIHIFLEQVEQIKQLRKKIEHCYMEITDLNELRTFQDLLKGLSVRYNDLDEARTIYKKALNSVSLKVAKSVTAVITGILFFVSGFFSGQTLVIIAASLFTATVSVTLWPVIVSSIVVGLAAFSIYWFVERPGLQNLIGRLFGLDKDNIDAFADNELVTKQKQKFHSLESRIDMRLESLQERAKLHQTIHGLTLFNNISRTQASAAAHVSNDERTSGPGLIAHSKSMDDLSIPFLPEETGFFAI